MTNPTGSGITTPTLGGTSRRIRLGRRAGRIVRIAAISSQSSFIRGAGSAVVGGGRLPLVANFCLPMTVSGY